MIVPILVHCFILNFFMVCTRLRVIERDSISTEHVWFLLQLCLEPLFNLITNSSNEHLIIITSRSKKNRKRNWKTGNLTCHEQAILIWHSTEFGHIFLVPNSVSSYVTWWSSSLRMLSCNMVSTLLRQVVHHYDLPPVGNFIQWTECWYQLSTKRGQPRGRVTELRNGEGYMESGLRARIT